MARGQIETRAPVGFLGFSVIRLLFAIAIGIGSARSASMNPVESFVAIGGPNGPLKGTMLSPGPEHGPVVLIIPGSGPTDRDGNSPAGLKASTYKLLAEGLVEHGVTTVRIDKRGLFASSAGTRDPNAVTIPDYVTDVHGWIERIRQQTGSACVWLLGHSEGGLIAIAAAQNRQDVCGLVLVAAAGRSMGEVLRDQLKANPANAPLLPQALPAIDGLEAGKHVDTTNMHPALAALFRPQVQGFLISAFSYDPAQLLKTFSNKPVLIIQGQRDIQVGEADALLLKAADPGATLLLLPDVNHVLKTVTSDNRQSNIATYADPSLPLAPGIVKAISSFLGGKASEAR